MLLLHSIPTSDQNLNPRFLEEAQIHIFQCEESIPWACRSHVMRHLQAASPSNRKCFQTKKCGISWKQNNGSSWTFRQVALWSNAKEPMNTKLRSTRSACLVFTPRPSDPSIDRTFSFGSDTQYNRSTSRVTAATTRT